jgi:hypothetical protein
LDAVGRRGIVSLYDVVGPEVVEEIVEKTDGWGGAGKVEYSALHCMREG